MFVIASKDSDKKLKIMFLSRKIKIISFLLAQNKRNNYLCNVKQKK